MATVFGYLPVTAVQILWINLVTDSGPAVALASDPSPRGAMREPPLHGAVLGRSMAALVGSVGVVKSLILLATFFIGLRLWDLETARTMTFTGFVVQEYLRLLVIRIQEGMPICTNKWLWAAVSVSLLLQIVIVYTPIGSTAFGTVALGLEQWSVLLAGLGVGFAGGDCHREGGRAAIRLAVACCFTGDASPSAPRTFVNEDSRWKAGAASGILNDQRPRLKRGAFL